MRAHRQRLGRLFQFAAVLVVAALLQSCGHGGGDDSPPLPSLSNSLTVHGAPMQPDANVVGGTPVVLADTGGTTKNLSITYSDGSVNQLINDPKDKTHFWMPLVTEATKGTLTATQDGKATASMPVSLAPYATTSAPGQITLNFLYGNKIRQQAGIDIFTGKAAYATALRLLTDALTVTDQQIAWVTKAIKNGSTTVEDPIRSTTGVLDQAGLKMMDQSVMQWVAQVFLGQVKIASATKMGDFFLAFIPSARATDTFTACHLNRPAGAPTSASLQEDQAWCVAQIHINDAEEVANYINAIGEGVKYAGLALAAVPIAITAGTTAAVTVGAIATGLIYTAQITGYSADLLSILASASNGRLSEAAVKTVVAAVNAGTSKFIEDLPLPLPKALGSPLSAALESLAKAALDKSYKEAIEKSSEDLVDAAKERANAPTAPAPTAPAPTAPAPTAPAPPAVNHGDEGFYAGVFKSAECSTEFCPSVTYTGNSGTQALAFRTGNEKYNLRIDQDFGCISASANISPSTGSSFGYSLSSDAPLTYPSTSVYTITLVASDRIEGTLVISSSFPDLNHPGVTISGKSTYTWVAFKVKPFAKCLPPTKQYQGNSTQSFFCPIYGSEVNGFGCDFIPVSPGRVREGEWAQ